MMPLRLATHRNGVFGLRSILILICGLFISNGFAGVVTPRQMIFKTSSSINVRADRTGIDAFDSFLDRFGAVNMRPITGMHTDRYYLVDLTEEADWATLETEQFRFTGIEYFQPNRLSKMHLTPNDPLFPQQLHHLSSIPQAWNFTTGSPLVVVGVIDSGILREHPDLQANLYINPNEVIDGTDTDGNGYIDDWCGWDFVDAPEMADIALGDYLEPDNDVTDENFHGTHVSGIIGAVGNNATGVAGVAWNVRLMPLRAGFRTSQGSGYLQDDDAASAIIYAADNGCHVVNMSWGDPNYSPIIADACQYAYEKGVILVASAGNDPGPNLSYPAKLSSVISVGAVNRFKNLAGFSSYGVDLDLVAPGEQILSTYKLEEGELYTQMSGTSMSAPYVTGSIALLLSLQPGLSPQEVRSRLLNSTDDLGAIGFDQFYGHGLLNTYKLLDNLNPPIVDITYPYDQLGVTDSFDILGTVHGADFFRYSVMYTSKKVPSTLDWYDVSNHTNHPQFFYQPVQNGVIAHFGIMPSFPEGMYTIRVIYENGLGSKYHYYHTIRYDRSEPSLVAESLYGFKRYDKQNLRYYVSAKFSEPVRSELKITAADGSMHYTYATLMDSLQVWALPPHLPQGSIDIQISAANISNIQYQSSIYENFLNIAYELIPVHGYISSTIGEANVPLGKTFDFSGNGIQEYISMALPTSGYGNVTVKQPSPIGHIQTHDFNDNFWPMDIGNTTASGQEILYLSGDTARLMDTKPGSVYPDTLIWSESGISGGVIADYSGDGTKDILLVKNLPAARVIQAYSRSAGGPLTARNTLYNTTPTTLRNTFVPTIIVQNFDNDAYPDILTADTDGDIMIYEIYNNSAHNMVWSRRLPVGNAYYMCSGDFDGNGRQDFMVGGYYRDILNPDMNFWYFEGFRNTGDNSYASMGHVMFNDILSQNAIHAYDLDNDGKDEIILALTPNLYVLKYENGKFQPQWYGESHRTYRITAWRDEANQPFFMTNVKADPDTVISVQWTMDQPFSGPPTPANFIATPLNGSDVSLSWIDSGADKYIIYRKDENDILVVYDNLPHQIFIDTGLVENHAYRYALIAVDDSYPQPNSIPSLWQTVIPRAKPVVSEIEMISSTELRVIFNQIMPSSSLNPGFFRVDNDMGNPYSVNHIMNQHGFQLRFRTAFPDIDGEFILSMRNIKGATGVAIDSTAYSFVYVPDIDPPRVESAYVKADLRTIEIVFNEDLHNLTAAILANYTLQSPSNDETNSLISVSALADRVLLTLSEPVKSSNQPYFVIVENVSDLSGNRISPLHNIAKVVTREIKNLNNIITYPNPVRASIHESIAFLNFPRAKTGNIYIYNSAGQIVYHSAIGPFNPESNKITWRWNLTNNDGRKVSSGVYFYLIDMDGHQKRGKIALIR